MANATESSRSRGTGMIFVFIVLGAVIGGSLAEFEGVVTGAVFGYLLGSSWDLRKRIKSLESTLSTLQRQAPRAPAESPLKEAPSPPLSSQPFPSQPVPDQSWVSPPSPLDSEAVGSEADALASPGMASLGTSAATEKTQAPGRLEKTAGELHSRLHSIFRDVIDRYVLGGSLVVKVGVVVLFFGVAFLLKYAAERDLLPIEIRLAGAAAGGIALLITGWRLRVRRAAYGLVLQGGGVGILYLTVFAALRLYSLIPAPLAFAILVGVAALSAALAVLQDSRSLVVLGIMGGFAAPILTSTGTGSHVMLFSFYALLNASILAIAWFKAWRSLNLVGFVFTFTLGSTWGYRYYQPDYFSTTEPFLILFFLFYVAVSVLFALRQPPQLKGYVDGTLVFGTPLIAFTLQSLLVQNYAHGIALSALGFGLMYLGSAWMLFLKAPRSMRMLTEAFLAIGIVFGTLTIPLALDNRWTAVAWALEGAAMLWIGIRQDRLLARCAGVALQVGAGAAFLQDVRPMTSGLAVLNGAYLSCLVVSCGGLFSGYYLHLNRDKVRPWEYFVGIALAVWGLFWWYGAGLNEVLRFAPSRYDLGSVVLFLALSSLIWDFLEKRLQWPLLAYPALGLLPALAFVAFGTVFFTSHPLNKGGWLAWPAAFAICYFILYRHEEWRLAVNRWLHAGTLWLLAFLVAWELGWRMDRWVAGADTWTLVAWGFSSAGFVLLLLALGPKLKWPVGTHYKTYLTIGLGPIALLGWGWLLAANFSSTGDPRPLVYLPLLNPLDLTTSFVFFSLIAWYLKLCRVLPESMAKVPRQPIIIAYAASLFFWLNATLVRTLHFWGGVGFSFQAMFQSVLFQSSISIFWSVTALGIMVFSTRRKLRVLWMVGAGLLGVVVVKLFSVDLSNSGTIERIVTFIGVGILLLIVGYFSPVPPRNMKETTPT